MLYVSEPARLSAQSALRFGGVRDLCAFFLNSCGLFVVQRQHLLVQDTACAPPLAQFTLIVFKSARACAWKRQCRLAAAVRTTCVLRVLVLARAPRQPRPAEAKAIWRFQDFCIVYACVRVGGCCMCERDEQ